VSGKAARRSDGSILHVADENFDIPRKAIDEVADLAELLSEARTQAVVDQDRHLDVSGAGVRQRRDWSAAPIYLQAERAGVEFDWILRIYVYQGCSWNGTFVRNLLGQNRAGQHRQCGRKAKDSIAYHRHFLSSSIR